MRRLVAGIFVALVLLYTVSQPQFRRYPRGFFADLESWLLVGPRR
jgi:hypothetical protein